VTAPSLDAPEIYARLDPTGLFGRITGLPDQIAEAWDAASGLALPDAYASSRHVAVLGMGGSGIGGSLLRALALELGATARFDVVRGYTLPGHVGPDTLAFASSNSGNTEEVVALTSAAIARNANVIAVTTGGRLLDLARTSHVPVLEYTWRHEPRAALGWSFASLVRLSSRLGLLPDLSSQLPAALDRMRKLVARSVHDVPEARNPAKQLARSLLGGLPVVVGSECLVPVAYRWRTQINENAKSWAIAEELPEMNHNAPVGYGAPPPLLPLLRVVLLRSAAASPRILKRIQLTQEQLTAASVSARVVDVEGESVFEQLLWAIQLGDLSSYYLGILNGADPSEVRALDWLKERMARP